MATLADLVKRQRRTGASASGALLTAVGQKTLEAIDPRKMFNQTGLLTALFPSLKAYKTDAQKSRVDSASKELSGSTTPLLEQMVMKLDGLDLTMRLVAKNTMAMPSMSRDMNIMRQNVVKLVKLQGGQASTRADGFFLRAFERERATEAELQAAKERRATGKTSAVTAVKEKASSIPGLGMLMGLVGAITTFGSNLVGTVKSLSEVLGPLAKGGLSLIFDIAGSFAKLAVKGGGTLLALTGKGLASLLMRIAPFLLNPAVIGLLSAGAIAWLLGKMYTSDSTKYGGDGSDTLGSEMGLPSPPESTPIPETPTSETVKQLQSSRENMRSSDDAAVRQAAVELDRTSPLSTSPTPIPLVGFEKMAVDMIKKHEGLPKNGKAYVDAHGHSIGYGHFITPAEKERGYIIAGDEKIPIDPNNILNTTITKEQAEKLLAHDLPKYINAAKVPLGEAWEKLNDAQKAALVSSAYNTGQGGIQHLVKKGLKDAIMRGDFKTAGKIIKEHGFKTAVMDGQRQTVAGLVRRREEEGAIISGQASNRSSQLASASSAVSDARQQMSTQPVVINAPTTNVQQQPKSQNQQPQPNLPNTIDEDLFKALLDRTTGYA
jgi:GH24 family phage-related lysozyme (muramidase)